ncbi:Lrp/AsnC family transcriptional regulator [Ruicaihuangia caeni]|uniref:Lrp/AsnC family transcriptional regulator n=1 Tax=Ruicaihuangia caeni TaxID=3042517 RepID=UPI00338D630E
MVGEVPNGFDQIDRAVAAALQVNGRATWGAIARVLDIPERTVSRRGQRLLEDGTVRVSTYMDVSRVAHARGVLLRLRTDFHCVHDAAAVLAHRDDASSVSILEGSGEIAALLLPADADAHNRLLFHDLPSIKGVQSFGVGTVTKMHRSGYDWNAGGLSDEQVALLTSGMTSSETTPKSAPVSLDAADRQLVELLERDGRASLAALAADSGLSLQTTRRKMEALFRQGVLHVRTEVPAELFGFQLEAMMWIQTPAGLIDELGRALGSHHNVRFCAASTGRNSLLIDTLFADEEELYAFQTGVIGRFPTAEIAESRVVLTAVRRGPLIVLDQPERLAAG